LTGVALMASALFASPAWATFPEADGRIAFGDSNGQCPVFG
jgi:hypothetical protein